MGKGYKKTKKGKSARGSYGVTRQRKKSKGTAAPKKAGAKKATAPKVEKTEAAPKKVAAKKVAAPAVEKTEAAPKKAAAKKVAKKKED